MDVDSLQEGPAACDAFLGLGGGALAALVDHGLHQRFARRHEGGGREVDRGRVQLWLGGHDRLGRQDTNRPRGRAAWKVGASLN